jgi:hypothetical protein
MGASNAATTTKRPYAPRRRTNANSRRGLVAPLQGPPRPPPKAHASPPPRGRQIYLLSTERVPAPKRRRRRIDNHHPATTAAGRRQIHSHQRSSPPPKLPTVWEENQRDQILGSRQRWPNLATVAAPAPDQTLTNQTLAPPDLVTAGPHHVAPPRPRTQPMLPPPGGRMCRARPGCASLHDLPRRRARCRTSRRVRG